MNEKVKRMVEWFSGLTESQKIRVAKHLFEFAYDAEYVNIHDPDDVEFLAEESGEPKEKFLGAYFTTCGDSLLS